MSLADRVRAKTARRILPYFFLLYIVAYLDRANVAFAKLSMAPDLDFPKPSTAPAREYFSSATSCWKFPAR